ncbi:MAG: ATP-binding protein [Bacteroidota bacterium]
MDKSIKELIKAGENACTEFKKTITHVEKMGKTLSAFANSGGGTVLIGVDDNGRICGTDPEEEIYMLDKAARFYCRPELSYTIRETEHEGHIVLLVQVPQSPERPHACLSHKGEWRVYVRSGNQCLPASEMLIRTMSNIPVAETGPLVKKFSKHEQALLDYLGKKHRITLKEFASLINVSRRRALRLLIAMVGTGDIYEHDFNREKFYTAGNG